MAASQSAPVMIVGPSGAGKERVAKELHRLSNQSGRFVAVNCATLSESLAESALFGHVRGAFTGAERDQPGLFLQADGGTLFLDEVATIPPAVQPKLLRAIQEGEVRPLGASQDVRCRPRIVCATNEDLQQRVVDGLFREDLYARLLGALIDVPGVSERREDIGYLTNLLMPRHDGKRVRVSPELSWALFSHPWPLNVRSLEQCLCGHVAESREGVLRLSPSIQHFLDSQRDLAAKRAAVRAERAAPSPASSSPPNDVVNTNQRRARVERPSQERFVALLTSENGSVEGVARKLGVRRQQIYRWLDAYGLTIGDYRQ